MHQSGSKKYLECVAIEPNMHDDEKLAELSQKQKQLKNEADSCQSKDKRGEINKNRNNVMKEIRKFDTTKI